MPYVNYKNNLIGTIQDALEHVQQRHLTLTYLKYFVAHIAFQRTRHFTYDLKDKDEKNKLQRHYFHSTRFSAVVTMHPVTKND
jgi:hypothetical protein